MLAATLLGVSGGAQPSAALAQTAYIANHSSFDISVIDTRRGVVVATFKPKEPVGDLGDVAITLGGSRLFVFAHVPRQGLFLHVLDTRTGRQVQALRLDGIYKTIAASPDGRSVYVIGSGVLEQIAADTLKVMRKTTLELVASTMAVSRDGRRIAASSGFPDVVILDATKLSVVSGFDIKGNPQGLAWSADGSRVYATDNDHGVLRVLDVAHGAAGPAIKVGVGPGAVAITPDGRKAYVANSGQGPEEHVSGASGSISVIDLRAGRTVATLPAGQRPHGVAITPDGSRAYVVNYGSGSVTVVDTRQDKVIATIKVGEEPELTGNFIGPAQPLTEPAHASPTSPRLALSSSSA